jgi:hypothetical protein
MRVCFYLLGSSIGIRAENSCYMSSVTNLIPRDCVDRIAILKSSSTSSAVIELAAESNSRVDNVCTSSSSCRVVISICRVVAVTMADPRKTVVDGILLLYDG